MGSSRHQLGYRGAKATSQFPVGELVPALVTTLVRVRIAEANR